MTSQDFAEYIANKVYDNIDEHLARRELDSLTIDQKTTLQLLIEDTIKENCFLLPKPCKCD